MSRLSLRAAFSLVALAVAALAPCGAAASEENLSVAVDHARILKIARPAETIIIGNPAIVDATVHDARTLVLTGRSYGLTNLVVLDAEGEAILDERVVVTADEAHSVRVYRQAERTTFACNPECQPSVTVGDNNDAFSSAAQQFGAREQMAAGSN